MSNLQSGVQHSSFSGGSVVKNAPASAGDSGSVPESGRSPGRGNGSPLEHFAGIIPWSEEPGGPQSMGLQESLT